MGIVYKVLPGGLEGKCLVLGLTPSEKLLKQSEKALKKQGMSKEEIALALEAMQSGEYSPRAIERGKGKGTVFLVDEWEAKLKPGWKLPTVEDAADIAETLFGGLGKDHKIGLMSMAKDYQKFSEVGRGTMMTLAMNGYIVGNAADRTDIKFVNPQKSGGFSPSVWHVIEDKFTPNVMTIAVSDF